MTEAGTKPDTGVVAMNHDARDTFDRALRTARVAAFRDGEFVGQESFMQASEILRLAEHARIGPGTSVLDVCCGVGGPGLLIARRLGCDYRGVDASAAAVHIARARAGDLSCRFDVSRIPPLPSGRYDVVFLLETMLAFPDKQNLLRHVCEALPVGGRFAFTVEEGQPLTRAEQELMPDSSTVWLAPLPEILADLSAAGLRVSWQAECSRAHQAIAQRLYDEFVADARNIAGRIGSSALDSLLTAHRNWSTWLRHGRVRKFALVAEKIPQMV